MLGGLHHLDLLPSGQFIASRPRIHHSLEAQVRGTAAPFPEGQGTNE